MRIFFISSEIYPYAKTGGLADVSSSLPKELIRQKHDVVSVMPLYGSVDRKKHKIEKTAISFNVTCNHHLYPFDIFQSGTTYFLANAVLFEREEMYGDYADNAIRFGIFGYAVMELAKLLGKPFDVIHVNDWQSGLVPFLAKERYRLNAKIVLTIHNLAYQGVFPKKAVVDLGLGWSAFTMHRFEFYDRVNFLKGAIAYSDRIVAASPRYAREIQTPEFGCELESFLHDNSHKLSGVLNGIDAEEFNPAKDPALFANFSSPISREKQENKEKLLEALGLQHCERPLFVFIGRLTWQKGIDVIAEALHYLKDMHINIAILGSGEAFYNEMFKSFSGVYGNLSVTLGYDEALARRLYAASDFLLMPSVYEPCGLNQMIAMSYGSVPIVRKTGGLADSVEDFTDAPRFPKDKGVGVCFEGLDRFSFLHAVSKAISLYADKKIYRKVLQHNKSVDNSWSKRAGDYVSIYNEG